jgi:hypothetical protein
LSVSPYQLQHRFVERVGDVRLSRDKQGYGDDPNRLPNRRAAFMTLHIGISITGLRGSGEVRCVMAAVINKVRAFFAGKQLPERPAIFPNRSSLSGAAAFVWSDDNDNSGSLPEELVKDEADRQEVSQQFVVLSNSIFASVGC